MGYRVIGLDVNDSCLEQVTAAGADLVYNTKDDPSYLQALKSATCGGADAVAVYTGSSRAYSEAHKVLRVNGLLMLIGIPAEPLQVSVIDLCNGKYRIKAESASVPRRMKEAIAFSIAHNILPDTELYALDHINVMIDKMKAGQSTKRMAVVFDT
jgi:propanol-preferring alcohol dehydrogenase